MEEVVESHNRLRNPLPSTFLSMGTIVINGQRFRYNGSLSIINGKYFVDGKEVKDWSELTKDQKEINITIEGDVNKLDVDCCDRIYVKGNVGKVKSTSGDIEVEGDVDGDVQTVSGDISCGNVGGDASTVSGNIRRK